MYRVTTKREMADAIHTVCNNAMASWCADHPVGESRAVMIGRMKEAIMAVAREWAPLGVVVGVIEEDDDTLLIREIMEEPDEEIRVNMLLPASVDRLAFTVKLGR